MNFEFKEINVLKNRVAGINKINDLFLYNKQYKEYCQSRFTDKTDSETNRAEFISRVFWYMFVSNQIAYSLQYQENPEIHNKENEFTAQPMHSGDFKSLLKDLNSLDYNIVTNDGNKFICEPYYKFFQAIQTFLLEKIANVYG